MNPKINGLESSKKKKKKKFFTNVILLLSAIERNTFKYIAL